MFDTLSDKLQAALGSATGGLWLVGGLAEAGTRRSGWAVSVIMNRALNKPRIFLGSSGEQLAARLDDLMHRARSLA